MNEVEILEEIRCLKLAVGNLQERIAGLEKPPENPAMPETVGVKALASATGSAARPNQCKRYSWLKNHRWWKTESTGETVCINCGMNRRKFLKETQAASRQKRQNAPHEPCGTKDL
jgi:hypothetical protein